MSRAMKNAKFGSVEATGGRKVPEVATASGTLLGQARAEGYRAGLEEAARLAEEEAVNCTEWQEVPTQDVLQFIAARLRALARPTP